MKIILTTILLFLFTQQSYALSNKDVQLYKTIFNDYRNGDFKKGDESVAQLDDQILMGHVEALKLLHPTKHRSSFLELRDWLDKYNDQYEATRIYNLGVKRKPSGAVNPKKNIYPELNEIFLEKSEAPKTINNLSKIFTSSNLFFLSGTRLNYLPLIYPCISGWNLVFMPFDIATIYIFIFPVSHRITILMFSPFSVAKLFYDSICLSVSQSVTL